MLFMGKEKNPGEKPGIYRNYNKLVILLHLILFQPE